MILYKPKNLNRKLAEIRAKKLSAVKEKDFERAANYRSDEKKLTELIAKRTIEVKTNLPPIKYYQLLPTELYGFFIQKTKDSLPEKIETYYFSIWFSIYLEAAVAESSLLLKTWNEEKINIKMKEQIIEQATSYFFVRLIMDYFNCGAGKFSLNREDIKDLVNSNLFVKLFSTPMSVRPSFQDGDYDPTINSHFALSDDKKLLAFYEAFEYKFEYKSQLASHNGWVIFSTSLFVVKFRVSFRGNNGMFLPIDFSRYYLGFSKNSARRINVEFIVLIRLRILLPWNFKNLRKLKALRKEITNKFSAGHYFKQLNWEPIRMQSKIVENLLNYFP